MTHLPSTQPPLSPPPQAVQNGYGWAGFLLGICGLTLFWVPYIYPYVGGAAVALSAVGYSKAQTGSATNRKTAVLGIVLGTLALVLPVVGLLGLGLYVALHEM